MSTSSRSLCRLSGSRNGFTLVEVLASIVLLAILGLIIGQAFQASTAVLTQNDKDIEAYSDIRQAMDRLGLDLMARIKRNDIPLFFQKNSGNDSMMFYSAVPSTLPSSAHPRGIAQLFYRIGTSGSSNYCLQRASEGVTWDSGASGSLPFIDPASTLPTPTFPPDADYDDLSASVFRLEISFISASTSPGKILTTFPTTGGDWQKDVGALCITMAALDTTSRKLLSSPTAQMAKLVQQFPDATDNQSTLTLWNSSVQNTTALAAAATVPVLVASRIRIIERRFPVN